MSEPDRDLRSFLSELKHRKVFRVAGLYAVVAFVLWQANLGVGAGASLEKELQLEGLALREAADAPARLIRR